MKRILAILMAAAMVLQAGAFSVFADDPSPLGAINSITINDIVATWDSEGPTSLEIVLATGQNLKETSVTVNASDIQLKNGKYEFSVDLNAEDGFVFDNNLENTHNDINGIYGLTYSFPPGDTSHQKMVVTGTFENVINASPLADKVDMNKLVAGLIEDPIGTILNLKTFMNGAAIDAKASEVKKIDKDTYSYELVLKTNEGFTFNNQLEFLYDQEKYGYLLNYGYTLSNKNHQLVIKGLAKKDTPKDSGTDTKTVKKSVKPGASAESADKAITSITGETDPNGTVFSKLKFRSTQQTKTTIKLNWAKQGKAKKYVIYGNVCGKKTKFKKIATLNGASKTTYTVKKAGKKLKKGTYYKFIIVALNSKDKVVSTSKIVFAATKGGKVGNHKSVTVKKASIAKAKKLKKAKSLKLKAKAVAQSSKLKVKSHRKMKYESSNTKVATVNGKGVIKAKKKGKCYVYAYAQNGAFKKIKVVVK